ncbi:hypothetical protein FKG94_13500 [Exilibacterium tricleocarpae]|uniref:Uncharacterized protein n=1 Tax=Exilibacterium tricleocarpae TaxID=2591008 RepID=A0A545TLR1_9GAMM|nr:hypothetical protein [Exilibacterium tricleocarpae]TQV78091.1 hypothetical protein FKG94_13500 [Exilibacterium tricleocarpae]
MSYLDDLKEFRIDQTDIDRVADTWRERARTMGETPHPAAVYQTAAADLALGLIDLHRETTAQMPTDHSVKNWLGIVSGVDLTTG